MEKPPLNLALLTHNIATVLMTPSEVNKGYNREIKILYLCVAFKIFNMELAFFFQITLNIKNVKVYECLDKIYFRKTEL